MQGAGLCDVQAAVSSIPALQPCGLCCVVLCCAVLLPPGLCFRNAPIAMEGLATVPIQPTYSMWPMHGGCTP